MLQRPSVLITAILAAAFTVVSFVAAITFLAYNGRGTEALAAAVITPVIGLLVAILNRQSRLESQTTQIQHQTNGTTGRLLDAVLPTPTDPPR